MKNYQKAQMIAKNLPTGSYAAGCPTNVNHGLSEDNGGRSLCKNCQIDM